MSLGPGVEAALRASFAAQGMMRLIGAEVVEVAAGRCVVEVAYRPDLTQQDGFFHGGIVATLADTAAGYAAFTLMPERSRVLSVEFKVNLLAPARGERLRATGRVERAGRQLSVVAAEVTATLGGATRPVALLQGTMIRVAGEGP